MLLSQTRRFVNASVYRTRHTIKMSHLLQKCSSVFNSHLTPPSTARGRRWWAASSKKRVHLTREICEQWTLTRKFAVISCRLLSRRRASRTRVCVYLCVDLISSLEHFYWSTLGSAYIKLFGLFKAQRFLQAKVRPSGLNSLKKVAVKKVGIASKPTFHFEKEVEVWFWSRKIARKSLWTHTGSFLAGSGFGVVKRG